MAGQRSNVKFTINAAFFRDIKDDHEHLQLLLDRTRQLASNRPAIANHAKEFAQLLADLRDQLAFHFTLEEAYGYFEDAIERAPRFHDQAGRLRNQHAELYVMAQRIAERAAVLPAARIDEVVEQYLTFDMALKAHESAELRLILDAIHQDVGVGD